MPETRMSLGFPRPTPVVFTTLIALVAIFIVTAVGVRFSETGRAIYDLLALNPSLVFGEFRLWTLLTYALLHSLDSPFHLVFNCLVLYWFGPVLESRWGKKRFLAFMALAAIMGGLFVVGTYAVGLGWASVVGASAITTGLVVAWGFTFPDREVYFFFFRLRGIQLIYVTIAFEILNALSFSGVSAAGHFGGMLVGFFAGEMSPLRRYYLKLRLKRLQAQSASLRTSSMKSRAGAPSLRVIPGGQKSPPKDKRYLN